jgi:glycosyltransferase involved in cell wall biosynthesis
MKKILLVMPYFYPHKGGSQKYAEELYAQLLKLYPDDFSVDVLCYNTDKAAKEEKYRGMKIYRVPCWQVIEGRFALPYPWSLAKILLQLAKKDYDYVNTHLVFFDPAWWVWLYAKLINAQSVFTEHVASFPVHQNRMVQLIAKIVIKSIGRFSLSFYDKITVTNLAAKKFLKHEVKCQQKIDLIYGGVDTAYFSPSRTKKERLVPVINKRLKKNDILVSYVGRLIWTKGVEDLYQAIKSIILQAPDNVYFVLAGGGELEKKLRKQIGQDGLSQRVFLTGFISYEKVRNLLKISDIFVNPSHHNEGFPNTVLEAGACRNLVIATDNGGTAEVIENKKTGLLIPQKDRRAIEKSLLWTIGNSKERKKIARNLRVLLENKFDWSIVAEKYASLLESLIKERAKKPIFQQVKSLAKA